MDSQNKGYTYLLEREGKLEGVFNFGTRPMNETEKNTYGIFISHSNDKPGSTDRKNEQYVNLIIEKMRAMGLNPLIDKEYLKTMGGADFKKVIEDHMNCYAAVIIITMEALSSRWVNYEIGALSGKSIPVYFWDPDGILTLTTEKKNEYNVASYSHFHQFKPIYNDVDSLIEDLKYASPYAKMFNEETRFLTRDEFQKRVKDNVETVVADILIDSIDANYEELSDCKFGVLVPNFGLFYANHADGEHCYAKGYERNALKNRLCPQSGTFCALSAARALNDENKECVLLNSVLYTGRLYRKGDIDLRGNTVKQSCIQFHVPIHKLYGTEFKFIVDVPPNKKQTRIFEMFKAAGMEPSYSGSFYDGRIYLSLPDRRGQGLFRLVHQYKNNFLCPHALKPEIDNDD